jgi:hypothetical protein
VIDIFTTEDMENSVSHSLLYNKIAYFILKDRLSGAACGDKKES